MDQEVLKLKHRLAPQNNTFHPPSEMLLQIIAPGYWLGQRRLTSGQQAMYAKEMVHARKVVYHIQPVYPSFHFGDVCQERKLEIWADMIGFGILHCLVSMSRRSKEDLKSGENSEELKGGVE